MMIPPSIANGLRAGDLHFVITGANGWLGRTTLAMLEEILGDAVTERVALFGSRARDITSPAGRVLPCLPLERISALASAPTLLLHFAFETKDRVAGYTLDDFLRRNAEIDDIVLAAAEKLSPVGVFVPSSGAVYRQDRTLETDASANPYGFMKVRQEERWGAWSKTHDTALVRTRVFNLAGPYINKFDTYVLAAILLDIMHGEPIRLKANRPVIRSYVHTRDLMGLVLALLTDPQAPTLAPFDTVGIEEIEVGELAMRSATVLGRPGYPILRPPVAGTANRYVGMGETWREMLVRYRLTPTPLETLIVDTAAFLKNC